MSTPATIKDVATALGVWRRPLPDGGRGLHERESGYAVSWSWNGGSKNWRLTEAEALLFDCMLALPPERETCPDCEGAGADGGWQTCFTHFGDDDGDACRKAAPMYPQPTRVVQHAGGWSVQRGRGRPCPTCKGSDVEESAEWPNDADGEQACHAWCTERERADARVEVRLRPPVGPRTRARAVGIMRAVATFPGQPRGYIEVHRWARHSLGAMPNPCTCADKIGCTGNPSCRYDGLGWGDLEARDALAAFADELQWAGDPLGEALALWLTRAPCMACKGKGTSGWLTTSTPMPGDGSPPPVRRVPCRECGGTGLALDARVPALEGVARRLAGIAEKDEAA